jgi:hypothetical protein
MTSWQVLRVSRIGGCILRRSYPLNLMDVNWLCLVPKLWVNAMPSIPIDILRLILDHVDIADLPTICLLNKICCSFSQDLLYRDILISKYSQVPVLQTLTDSTHLAERVRSLKMHYQGKKHEVLKAFPNMINLRHLSLGFGTDLEVLDGCTSALVTFACCECSQFEPLYRFLRRQPSMVDLTITAYRVDDVWPELGVACLPNLTRVEAPLSKLSQLIPNRPVKEVTSYGYCGDSGDLSCFTLSASPIQKIEIDILHLYPKSGQYLASIFPSVTYLLIDAGFQVELIVCEQHFFINYNNP